MLIKFLFMQLSLSWQVNFMKSNGIMLGTRRKNGRQIYTYMFRNLFAEIIYKSDNPHEKAEGMKIINGLKKLKRYLESELRSV
jgi:hypothetical protein